MKLIYFAVVQKRNGKDHSWHHFRTQSSPPPTPTDRHSNLEKRASVHSERVLLIKYLRAFKYWLPLQMPQEKARLQGTRIALPAQEMQRLVWFLCKEMSTAAMLSRIRKTLGCNQALPGGQGFSGINVLPPCWLLCGHIFNYQCSLPSLPKNEVRSCSGVQPLEHRVPAAASPERTQSQCSVPLSTCRPGSFVERAGFCWTLPKSSVTKGAVIWTLDNDHSVFNETQTHMDNYFFLKCLQCMVSTTMGYKALLTASLTKELGEIAFSRNYQNWF